jgi:signal transduction histidine kinase
LSFRWQIILLGTLVVVLSLSVLFAIVATLRDTKSAVLRDEKEKLTQIARNLVQEFEERAQAARGNRKPPLFDASGSPASRDVLALLSRLVLQNTDGTSGGFYDSSTDSLLGQYFPGAERILESTGIGQGIAAGDSVLSVARQAAISHQPADKVIFTSPGIVLIEAVPLHDGYSAVGSAWTLKKLPDLPGANRFRAYLITAGLGFAALASVLLTLLVIRNLQGGVRKVESSLKSFEGNLTALIQTADEPRDILHVVQAINRLAAALREKIEHEKQIESHLRHSERLASLGRLVAGVAHEIRNPLATIRLRVQMSSRDSDNPRVKESCSIALLEIEHLNSMVNRLLNFARPVQLHLEALDLRQLLEERIDSFRDLALRCRVGMVADLSSSSPSLPVDKSRMAQVFDNIIQNAIEAMADRGGTLSVVMASHNQFPDGLSPSGVSVEFRDTGKGMNASMMSHIFDPFFTTKSFGTGLGLSICHELVRAHGGDIRISSEEGIGTTVRVSLPASSPVAKPQLTNGP